MDQVQESDKKRRTFPEKKDFIYWIIGLVIAFILSITWRGGDNTILVNQISLASGFASIILAVVAIIYAFYQSKTSSEKDVLVQSVLIKIRDKVDELEVISHQLTSLQESWQSSSSNMLGVMQEMNASIGSLSSEVRAIYENEADIGDKTKLETVLDKLERMQNDLNKTVIKGPVTWGDLEGGNLKLNTGIITTAPSIIDKLKNTGKIIP
ncbi:hypothetical protein [Ammoniphilus sp. YIM 78166]|uniref:hypothetical protein n=1 Tax=Ammoniphilus sp. YIM 78166 TaxID=1644106 RepID=UPI00106FD863|nr:hypothetical protein [Ammoniphilus sp. YIM 78166]